MYYSKEKSREHDRNEDNPIQTFQQCSGINVRDLNLYHPLRLEICHANYAAFLQKVF